MYICTDTDWKGRCGYAVQPLYQCITLGADWAYQISSFGPDVCTICTAFVCVFAYAAAVASLTQTFVQHAVLPDYGFRWRRLSHMEF